MGKIMAGGRPAQGARRPAVVALVGACAIWGLTFPLVKNAIEEIPPLEFLAIRFALAAAFVATISPRTLVRVPRETLRSGIVAGTSLAIGYGFQTIGLRHTTATNAGFVTGLFVVFAPLLSASLIRRVPTGRQWGAVGLAFAGLGMLTLSPGFEIVRGDLMMLVCAIAFAFHIVLMSRYSPEHNPRHLILVQLLLSTVVFTALSAAFERLVIPTSRSVWLTLALTAIGASAVGFLIQAWSQARLDAADAAVILTMEPVFAAIAGFLILGERLTGQGWVGAGLILTGMLIVDPGATRPVAEK